MNQSMNSFGKSVSCRSLGGPKKVSEIKKPIISDKYELYHRLINKDYEALPGHEMRKVKTNKMFKLRGDQMPSEQMAPKIGQETPCLSNAYIRSVINQEIKQDNRVREERKKETRSKCSSMRNSMYSLKSRHSTFLQEAHSKMQPHVYSKLQQQLDTSQKSKKPTHYL